MPKIDAMFANRPVAPLVSRAQHALGMTHEQFGGALGVSKRTATRWASRGASASVDQLRTLAALVYSTDPGLAAEIASAASATLEGLGIVAPPPPPPPPPPPLPMAALVEAVVCALADALNTPPSAVRGATLAAFRRARELRLRPEDVEGALTPPGPASSTPGARGPASESKRPAKGA